MKLSDTIKIHAAGPIQVAGIKNRVKQSLLSQLDEYELGKISARRLETRLKKRLAKAYEDVYALGSQGYLDEDFIQAQLEKEYGFLRSLFIDIRKDQTHMPLDQRLSMYADKLDSVYWSARVREKSRGKEIHWNLGESDKNCEDCVTLASNSPYTRDTLPTYPAAGDTKCLTSCHCYLTFV